MPFMDLQYDGQHMQAGAMRPEHNNTGGCGEIYRIISGTSRAGIQYIGELMACLPVL